MIEILKAHLNERLPLQIVKKYAILAEDDDEHTQALRDQSREQLMTIAQQASERGDHYLTAYALRKAGAPRKKQRQLMINAMTHLGAATHEVNEKPSRFTDAPLKTSRSLQKDFVDDEEIYRREVHKLRNPRLGIIFDALL